MLGVMLTLAGSVASVWSRTRSGVQELPAAVVPAELGIRCSADSRHNLRHGFDIRSSCVEVHDTRTQQVAAVNHCVGDERLASSLQAVEQLPIERVEIAFDRRLTRLRLKIARQVAERRDAQRLCGEFQVRVLVNRRGHRSGQPDVVADHFAVASSSHLADCEPHLQRPKAARVLRTTVDVVGRVLVEVIVERVVGECGAQGVRIAHQRAPRFERCIQPLVRIDGNRVRFAQRAQLLWRLRQLRSEAAVGSIGVEPHAVFPAQRSDFRQRIDASGADRPRRTHHETGLVTGGHVRLQLSAQRGHVHAEPGVSGDPADRGGAEATQVRGFLQPCVRLHRGIHAERASLLSGNAMFTNVPAGHRRARGHETDEVRHVAAADEQPAAIYPVAAERGDPAYGLRFDLGRGR